jgi:hypothetical protein
MPRVALSEAEAPASRAAEKRRLVIIIVHLLRSTDKGVSQDEPVRVTRSVLYMQEFPFRRMARVMTTAVALRDWYELPTSIGRRRHQDV